MALYASSSMFLTVQLSCAHYLGKSSSRNSGVHPAIVLSQRPGSGCFAAGQHGTPVFTIIFARETIITALAGLAVWCNSVTEPPAKQQTTHRRAAMSYLMPSICKRDDAFAVHEALLDTQASEATTAAATRWRLLMLRAVLGAVAICCSMWAVTLLDLGVNMILTALTPAWVALLSPALLREQPSRRGFLVVACYGMHAHTLPCSIPAVGSLSAAAQVVSGCDLRVLCCGCFRGEASLS